MEETIKLNDSTEIRGHLAETETRLFLYLYDISMRDAFDLLTDPQKTKYIQWDRGNLWIHAPDEHQRGTGRHDRGQHEKGLRREEHRHEQHHRTEMETEQHGQH